MTREIAFVLRVWTCAVVAGGAIAALFSSFGNNVEDALIILLVITFFAATRGIFALIIFYIITHYINQHLFTNKYKILLLILFANIICFLNFYLFLYRKKSETFFEFGPHLFIISSYLLAVTFAVYFFRNHLSKQETTD
ncbi:MAG: hypothetical protein IPI65_20315 [Bacteroidetes bacterium]|nr:hypothetical protein [Bacteroidota bacterium]